MKQVIDIFGKEIKPGDIVGYASSRGIFIVVVSKLTYNRLGQPVRFKFVYPKSKYDYYANTTEEIIEKRTMGAWSQELVLFSQEDIKNYCGSESFSGVDGAVNKVIGLSNYYKWVAGEGVAWVWNDVDGRGLGFYFLNETQTDFSGPYKTKEEAVVAQDKYLEGV